MSLGRTAGPKGKAMAKNIEKLEIMHKARILAIYLKRCVAKFNRAFKFTEGDGIVLLVNEVKDLIIDANNERNKRRSSTMIARLLSCLDKIEERTNDAIDLGLLTIQQKANADIYIDAVRTSARKWKSYYDRLSNSGGSAADESDVSAESPAEGQD